MLKQHNHDSCNTPLHLEAPRELICENYWLESANWQLRYILTNNYLNSIIYYKRTTQAFQSMDFLKPRNNFQKAKEGCVVFYVFVGVGVSFSKAFNEWRYCQYSLHKEEHTTLFECPCGTSRNHSIHMYGNKKLYWYSKVPR